MEYEEMNLKPEHVSAVNRPFVDSGPLSAAEYSDWLKSIREERGLTLADLSELTGYSTSHLSQVENGKKKKMPSPEYLEKLADPLGMRYSDLLQLAGYTDLAKGVRYREAGEEFPPLSENELRKIVENDQFLAGLTDLKLLLERKVTPHPYYNGHKLTDKDKQRILDMLKALFPEYSSKD